MSCTDSIIIVNREIQNIISNDKDIMKNANMHSINAKLSKFAFESIPQTCFDYISDPKKNTLLHYSREAIGYFYLSLSYRDNFNCYVGILKKDISFECENNVYKLADEYFNKMEESFGHFKTRLIQMIDLLERGGYAHLKDEEIEFIAKEYKELYTYLLYENCLSSDNTLSISSVYNLVSL